MNSAGALPQTPLGELTVPPDPLAGFKGVLLRGGNGKGEEGGQGRAGEGGWGERGGREGKGRKRGKGYGKGGRGRRIAIAHPLFSA